MDWRNNKLVGIIGAVVILLCIVFLVVIPIYKNLQERKRQAAIRQTKEYQEWWKQEQEALKERR
jgi:predicted Holliday junction resolvase-like endonuclease